MQNYNEKGQSMGAVGSIVGLIVGVAVAVLCLIFVGTLGGQTYELAEDKLDAIGNNAVTNDAFNCSNTTTAQLDHSFIQENTLSIMNATSVIELGNFTIDYDAGTVLLVGASYNGYSCYANYTWGASEVREYAKDSVISSFSALKQTGDYLPIVVLAVIIAIVLSLVLGFTAFGRDGGNNSAL